MVIRCTKARRGKVSDLTRFGAASAVCPPLWHCMPCKPNVERSDPALRLSSLGQVPGSVVNALSIFVWNAGQPERAVLKFTFAMEPSPF